MHLRMFRMPLMMVGAGHKFDYPMEKYGQIFIAYSCCAIIFVHINYLLIPHTRSPCHKRGTSEDNVCHIEGRGWKSPRASRHARRCVYPDRLVVVSDHDHACVHTHVRVNDAARGDEILQKIQAYNSPYVIQKVPFFENKVADETSQEKNKGTFTFCKITR
jgi:hypothetical protein